MRHRLEETRKQRDQLQEEVATQPYKMRMAQKISREYDELLEQEKNTEFGNGIGGKMATVLVDVAGSSQLMSEDWALFRLVAERSGSGLNVIPTCRAVGFSEELFGVGQLKKDLRVYKYGRTTGGTEAVINGLRSSVFLNGNDNVSGHWHVLPPHSEGVFSDSGAWVVNKDAHG